MRRIGYVAALAILLSVPVLGPAQEKKPAAVKGEAPAAKPAAKPAAAKVEPASEKPAAKMKVAAKAEPGGEKPAPAKRGPSRANEDARSCLQFPTNLEIHKCAEQYR